MSGLGLRGVAALAGAIQDLGSVPAGHLYAAVMDRMSLETFESIISVLVRAGVVRRDGSHLLTWIAAAPVLVQEGRPAPAEDLRERDLRLESLSASNRELAKLAPGCPRCSGPLAGAARHSTDCPSRTRTGTWTK